MCSHYIRPLDGRCDTIVCAIVPHFNDFSCVPQIETLYEGSILELVVIFAVYSCSHKATDKNGLISSAVP